MKLELSKVYIVGIRINRNMRCIEMIGLPPILAGVIWINRNMRCIEMSISFLLMSLFGQINRNMRCIEMGQ